MQNRELVKYDMYKLKDFRGIYNVVRIFNDRKDFLNILLNESSLQRNTRSTILILWKANECTHKEKSIHILPDQSKDWWGNQNSEARSCENQSKHI